jgi:hypothetical protein
MAQLVQNQNQFAQTPMLAQVSQIPNPNIFEAQILPASPATNITAGDAVKLVTGAGTQIQVEICTGPTDGPVFGFIVFNLRKNSGILPGDTVEIAAVNSVITLKASAAIARGANVSATPGDATNDPLVTTSVATNFVAGQALDRATAASQLIRVLVNPQPVVI